LALDVLRAASVCIGSGALALSCATPKPRPAEPEPVTIAPPTASAVASAPGPALIEHDRLSTDVREIHPVSCVVKSDAESLYEMLPLRIAHDAAPYAKIRRVAVELALAERADAGARLSAEADGYALRGRLQQSDFVLHPAGARAAGVIVPHPRAPLGWLGSDGDQVRVTLTPKGAIVLAPGEKLEWSLPCAALSLGHHEFDARTATGLGASSTPGYLDAATPVRIGTEPSGGSGVRIQSTVADLRVEIHERRAGAVRILRDDLDALWFGWVDASRVSTKPRNSGRRGGSHRTRPPRIRSGGERLVCDHDLPLSALGPDRSGVIGAVRAHTQVTVGAEAEDSRFDGVLRQLRNGPYWLMLESGVQLVVRASDLDDCRPPGAAL
jgi:hypothetical protein